LWNCIWSFSAGAAFFDATLTLLLLITFPALSFSIFSDEISYPSFKYIDSDKTFTDNITSHK
jgi:hypothetical protein